MPLHLEKVRDKLAENIHELWGMNKIELGWSYGKVRKSQIFLIEHCYNKIITLDPKIKSITHTFCHVCGDISITITHFLNKFELNALVVSSTTN